MKSAKILCYTQYRTLAPPIKTNIYEPEQEAQSFFHEYDIGQDIKLCSRPLLVKCARFQ